MQVITGFHAIEERVRKAAVSGKNNGMSLRLSKSGPRIKKILELAKKACIPVENCRESVLNDLVKVLPAAARDHRGIVLVQEGENSSQDNCVDFDLWVLTESEKSEKEKSVVLVLDSITDPHNVGAILRSSDQFGVSLVVMPARHSANDFQDNEIIARSSAGASAYVPVAVVNNLVRAVQKLKDAGFWIYGADAGGTTVDDFNFSGKTCLIMGSEGSGISRLLREQCDSIVSIPTCGKIDSLNVSVAAGVLLFCISRK